MVLSSFSHWNLIDFWNLSLAHPFFSFSFHERLVFSSSISSLHSCVHQLLSLVSYLRSYSNHWFFSYLYLGSHMIIIQHLLISQLFSIHILSLALIFGCLLLNFHLISFLIFIFYLLLLSFIIIFILFQFFSLICYALLLWILQLLHDYNSNS